MAALVVGIASIVLGIVPFLTAAVGLVAVVLGIVGMSKAKSTGTGKGMALAGLATGAVGMLIGLAWIAFTVWAVGHATSELDRLGIDVSADPTELARQLEAAASEFDVDLSFDQPLEWDFALTAGQCFNDPAMDLSTSSVQAVACEQPHDYEVIAVLNYPGSATDPYPGGEQLQGWAVNECLEPFEHYVGIHYMESDFFLAGVTPTEQSWVAGDREVACIIHEIGAASTGSARGAAR